MEPSASDQPGGDWNYLEGYEYTDALVSALGARIGCDQAAEYLAAPKEGFWDDVGQVMRSPSVYAEARDRFFARQNVLRRCRAKGDKPSPTAGMERLLKAAITKDHGVTFVMQGGFGSHLTKAGALFTSREAWTKLAQSQENAEARPLRIWRVECKNSYAPDDRCSGELVDRVRQLDQEEPSTLPHVYVFWGYSKGGTTVLQALATDPELRAKTAAVISVGSPYGGGVALVTLAPVLKQIFAEHGAFFEQNPALAYQVPLAFAMSPQAFSGYLNLLKPAEFAEVEQGANSILPEARKEYLFSKLKSQDFGREPDPVFGMKEVPVFHIASLLDIAEMRPFPLVTVKEGAVDAKDDSLNIDHTQELALVASFKDYPLSDSCVALQHAVLPKSALPANVTTDLLGLLRLDHLGLRLSYDAVGKGPIPYDAIVDAALDAVVTKLEGAPQ